AAGLADKIQLQVSYAIGRSKPVSIDVNTYGTGKVTDAVMSQIISDEFDLRPRAIITKFDLQRPIYQQTASYGHFGRNEFPWEKLDKVNDLRKYIER
ncbi:MAG: methionine adenosyltransferase domain-containing protein, partial [Clostridia bacterium]|nr:methionine adenosyltransferase domain-containing protein [Clostridia bacterium]